MTKKFSLTPYLFLTPAMIVILVFLIIPILAVVYLSFTDYNISTPPVWTGLKNYEWLLHDDVFLLALRHSFTYLLVTPILVIFSTILAIIVNRKLPGISAFRALYFVPVICGTIAVGTSWRLLLSTNGLFNSLLMWLGWIDQPVQWLAQPKLTLAISMLLTVWLGLGYYMMIFLAGLQNIDEDLYDAASIDGCNALQKHWYVSVPGLRPQMTFVAVISSLAALQVFNEVLILFGRLGGILNSGVTVVFYLWQQGFQLNHYGRSAAIAMALLLITLVFSIFNMRMLERGTEAD